MSRPPISYPSPIPSAGPSTYIPSPTPSHRPRPSLEPSPMSDRPRQSSGSQQARVSGSSRSNVGVSTAKSSTAKSSLVYKFAEYKLMMLQGLEQWAQGELDEEGVSDIYVRLGNEFDTCTMAFHTSGISTNELKSIPGDLRECLEQCLSEEPSQETLNLYLPTIRTIIFNLLNGLKQKQAAYKRLVQERTETPPLSHPPARSLDVPPPIADPDYAARISARSVTPSGMSTGSVSPTPVVSHLPAKMPSSQALAERARAGLPNRPPPPDAFRPPRRAVEQPRSSPSPQPGHGHTSSASGSSDQPALVRHQLSDNPVPSPRSASSSSSQQAAPPPPPKPIPHPDRFSRDSLGKPVSRFSMDSEMTNGSPGRSTSTHSPSKALASFPEDEQPTAPTVAAPPFLPTLNLPSSTLGFGEAEPSTPIEPPTDVPPETRATLAALGRSEALERRASKRFSSYTFNKLPGSPSQKRTATADSPQRPTRRADRPPPMPPLPESLVSSNLAVSAAERDRSKTPSPVLGLIPPQSDEIETKSSPSSGKTSRSGSSSASQEGSVRIIKTPEPSEIGGLATPRPGHSPTAATPTSSTASVFLQIGRQVKKTTLDLPVTLSSLRLLFMEKFDYDPGVEDFPDVYIRDTATGLQFELEDVDELRDGSLLTLNIEPMDQISRHVGQGFTNMLEEMKEMKKELKAALDHSRRLSMTPAPSLLAPSPSMTMSRANRPQVTPTGSPTSSSQHLPTVQTTPTPSSVRSMRTASADEAKLREQHDELQALRRDLAVMRQVHVDFLSETKEAFTKLRLENNNMREMVKTKMGGSRALLDNSKTKLEALCAETIQAVEEVSDTVDAAREDAFKRFVTPSRPQMAKIRADLKRAHELIDSFAAEVASIEPTWRATWHFELSRVMDEQRLLPHQTKLTVDLKSDIEDAEEMFKNVSDFVDQRTINKGLRPAYRPPTPDESGGGVKNLLMEIRTKDVDPNQRLRAIEAQQKAREKEKANQTDEFQDELAGFVQGRKLKKTGGTEEVDRQRQRKQDMTLRKMLTGDGVSGSPTGMLSPQTTGMSVMSQSSIASGTSHGTQAQVTPGGRASRASARSEDLREEL